MNPLFNTELGKLYLGDSEILLKSDIGEKLKGKVNLIMTSPPFPLNQKKSYGNKIGETYKDWFVNLAPVFAEMLAPDGSIVIEIEMLGNLNGPFNHYYRYAAYLISQNIPKQVYVYAKSQSAIIPLVYHLLRNGSL